MSNFLKSIGTSFAGMWRKSEGLSFKNVRPAMLVYALAYSLELIMYSLVQTFPIIDEKFMGLSVWTLMYIGHILFSLVIMLLWSKKFKPLIYISVAVLLAGFLPFILLPDGNPRIVFAILALTGLGGAVSCARCGFAFAANNAERVLGMLFMFLSTALLQAVLKFVEPGLVFTLILPLLLCGGLAFCLLKFKEKDLEAKEESGKGDAKGLYWALAYFLVYFIVDSLRPGFADTAGTSDYLLYYGGRIFAGILFALVLVRLKKSVWHLWNLFFVIAVLMAVFSFAAPAIGTSVPLDVFRGLSWLGWPIALYMLACAQRRFASYKLLKQSTLIFVLLSPITTLFDDLFPVLFPQASMPLISLIYVTVIVFVFFMLSPHSYKYLFSAAWLSDLHRSDMELLREKVDEVDRFEKYKLTGRERQITTFLLAANTRRQISGELGLSESTVKMHTSNLYKKLNINSRIELFRLFGVPEVDELPDNE